MIINSKIKKKFAQIIVLLTKHFHDFLFHSMEFKIRISPSIYILVEIFYFKNLPNDFDFIKLIFKTQKKSMDLI